MNCAKCGKEITYDQWILLNRSPFHVEKCFSAALQFKAEDLDVELSPAMPPMLAYHAGKSMVAVIVASRRKAKERRAAP